MNVADKKVLEIGLGEGADSKRLIRQGARSPGVDLTATAVERVRTRLTLRELPCEELRQGSRARLAVRRRQLRQVFSHGVLLHVPEIKQTQSEIHGYCA
jgi:cyclopropane fatty-acyl-phospholipid synthase-like methyltransferase